MPSIGQTLAEARREAGRSIEEAAHATRIHPKMIRYIEGDDYSLFASAAYAKGFIRNYAAFLKVDLEEALAELKPGLASRSEDEVWGDEIKETLRRHGELRHRLRHAARALRRRLERPGKTPVLLNLILAALIAALLVFYFLGFKAENAEEAKAEIVKGLRSANPFAGDGAREDEIEEEAPAAELPAVDPPDPEGALPEPDDPAEAETPEPAPEPVEAEEAEPGTPGARDGEAGRNDPEFPPFPLGRPGAAPAEVRE